LDVQGVRGSCRGFLSDIVYEIRYCVTNLAT
jgi:hypothetical protein